MTKFFVQKLQKKCDKMLKNINYHGEKFIIIEKV